MKQLITWPAAGILAAALIAGIGARVSAADPSFEFQPLVIAEYLPSPGMGTGVAVADFDGDGDPDIFLPTGGAVPNRRYRNRGDGTFDEVAAAVGLDELRQARSALFVDYDGDGDLDLAATNGYCEIPISDTERYCDARHERDRSRFFENRDDAFVEAGQQVGFNDTLIGAALVAADFDGDGRLDLLQTAINPDSVPWANSNIEPRAERLTLYFNRPSAAPADPGSYARVKAVHHSTGSPVLGTEVRLFLDGAAILTRLVSAGESWMSQAPATVHFGIPAGAVVERMELGWPDPGGTTTLPGPAPGETVVVVGPKVVFGDQFEVVD